ncbi:MAG: tetraacyldisaccharide 4'-kinase [Pseudomonadota bacterium]
MTRAIQKAWKQRGGLARLLWPVSVVYRLLAGLHRRLYQMGLLKSSRLPVPVIVVGNVVAGGGGKTPLVIALVQHLQLAGWQVGVVSRGYGRSGGDFQEVLTTTTARESGDEPLLIKRRTGAPVFVGSRRVAAAAALLQAHPGIDLIVCDDGLQHHALQRDLEIIVFDDGGVGNGWLLPAGPLREPWPNTKRNIPCLVLHTGRKPSFDGFKSSRRLATNAVGRDGTLLPLETLQRTPVSALAAIANPEAFFAMLTANDIALGQTISFPDHHRFTDADLQSCHSAILLCTEKDAVKLFDLAAPPSTQVLAVPLEFEPEPAFFSAFDALLRPLLSKLPSSHGHQTA